MTKLLALAAALALPFFSAAAPLGTENDGSRIVNGTIADPGQFPSMLLMSLRGGPLDCGAVLIGPKTALTAAHCLRGAQKIQVRAGSTQQTSGGVVSQVSSWLIHPEWTRPDSFDLAILYLTDFIRETENIRYAELPAHGHDPRGGKPVTVVGWGAIYDGGPSSQNLRFVTVPVISRPHCRLLHAGRPLPVTEAEVCAGKPHYDSCFGDSGGPLFTAGTNKLVGLVSRGYSCATTYGGVYTRIGYGVDWIRDHMIERPRPTPSATPAPPPAPAPSQATPTNKPEQTKGFRD
ncbi:hypothetical protein LOZ12_005285 [Ophidiomyces ophidiicola]|uniref:Uncharacterized protein n=1 Tax=Ophidiomyces ophidiicola TaxID=1387563 RepID=A0ACB8UPU7_9EURO|nr:hypothetical protein LOZ62_002222 [Ophidiomyces ophidiicola]KAI2009693.1 hypothetical protein LOZ50_001427 [Ophidiomyces ophidiicola]KAI2023065.1 hypothetical protein LOZ45_004148 [Ophidiomyces ophidiicola]KAI2033717.1 hypothetical protein LOZ47_005328 [Ophidiomyces ophidiicola]KAI2046107.1 hypothetical protein LOZ38_005542 [Ophidiomyces ophidiicola]